MALPVDVLTLGSFKGTKGDEGAKGDTGTLDFADGFSVPADQDAAVRMVTDSRGTGAEIDIPRGLPGVNALDNDEAVATYLGAPDSATGGAAQEVIASTTASALGVVYPAGAGLGAITFTSLQDAADLAASEGKRLVAAGTITTDQTLVITSDIDLSALTINYNGAGTAVQVGVMDAVTFRIRTLLPKVINVAKSSLGWDSVAGSIGIDFVNTNTIYAEFQMVQNFEIGMRAYGNDQGNAYNTFQLGQLQNNKVGLQVSSSPSGWTNQNLFEGGRIGANSAEGTNIAGCYRIEVVEKASNRANNNMFVNISIEGNTPEYHLVAGGVYNTYMSLRFEAAAPKVFWPEFASMNRLVWAYNGHLIQHTYGNEYSRTNTILADQTNKFSSDLAGQTTLELESSQAGNRMLLIKYRQDADYTMLFEQLMARFKRRSRDYDSIQVVTNDSALRFGDGTAEPTAEFRLWGSSFRLNASLTFTGGTADIGATNTAARPRDILASRVVVTGVGSTGSRPTGVPTGSMFLDTTLNKPLWMTAAGWRDATGTLV